MYPVLTIESNDLGDENKKERKNDIRRVQKRNGFPEFIP